MPISIEVLAAQPFLKGLSSQHLHILGEDALPVEFRAGDVIFKEGEPANRFYLIRSGEVALESATDGEHEPILIETVGVGSAVGWSWLFPPYYWHFSVRATTPVRAIFFYGTRLREQCEKNHELGYELMSRMNEVLVERLQATRRQLCGRNLALPTAA
ncbi:MAG: cyclic nucleotide-binding domain-containing protein [Limisphaerales bacterium]